MRKQSSIAAGQRFSEQGQEFKTDEGGLGNRQTGLKKMFSTKTYKSEAHLSPPEFPDCIASLLSTTEGQENLLKNNQRKLRSSINHMWRILGLCINSKYHKAHDETTKLGRKCHCLATHSWERNHLPKAFISSSQQYIPMPEPIKPISAFPVLLMISRAGLWRQSVSEPPKRKAVVLRWRFSQTPEARCVAAPKRFDFPDTDPKVSL